MKERNPKVSIVLPTYNGSRYIRQSIDSCLSQTYENIELLIVDDGSTDNTSDIIKFYDDKRLTYIRHKTNLGLPRALNTGFAKASGDYLTWTSDDNYFSKKAIEMQLSFLTSENCSFVYCDYFTFNASNPSALSIVRLNALQIEKRNGIGFCFLYSRGVRETIGDFDPDLMLAEDYDYWIRVSKKFSMRHLAEPLYYCRDHPNSLTNTRFYEVKVAEILSKIKNQVPTDSTLDYLTFRVTEKYPMWIGLRRIARSLLRIRIRKALRYFEIGKLSVEQARATLNKIIANS